MSASQYIPLFGKGGALRFNFVGMDLAIHQDKQLELEEDHCRWVIQDAERRWRYSRSNSKRKRQMRRIKAAELRLFVLRLSRP